jgi:hypothetical protein
VIVLIDGWSAFQYGEGDDKLSSSEEIHPRSADQIGNNEQVESSSPNDDIKVTFLVAVAVAAAPSWK